MRRERALKIVFVVVGLLFCAAVYPLLLMVKEDPALAMMMSLYAMLGIFLVLASHNPLAHHSLIAFAAWSSFGTPVSWQCKPTLVSSLVRIARSGYLRRDRRSPDSAVSDRAIY